ncbi:MAG TPA: phosphate ABC transporter permease PstA [Nocardioides sp.]|uniref:phosphate ABC transporter permease PstA n=1 Tax=uncultured Nocardioides sp. TaxID=198441 RepID=UPI002604099B|nr:phosphate ABC transporter permease PstA [uncultured Nocardioides sp.]HRI94518.1 phosphate ABC transporter permease PstA [Nocardioides sp.]HRK44434.1 phosphate ABC transporter permease PstA [Nocardioides sp.]
MTTVDAPPRGSLPLAAARLPVWAPGLVAAVAFGASGLLALLAGWGITAFVVLAAFLFVAGLPLWSAVVEGRRGAMDRLMTSAVWTAFVAALIPLVWLIWTVLSEGLSTINSAFLTYDMRNVVGDDQGGIYHAIIGTLLVTAAAAIISVPVGLFCAIYLVEYGKGKQLARWITFLVDVMTGIPSIVAGLFALALFVLLFGPEIRLGFGGSVALSLLMIPIVVRSTEEMLRLVPDDLREASYALGVPKWRTISKVVLPTCIGGIITGITLATARIIGETAPLLVIAGKTDSVNFNLFGERMTTLPVYIYYSFTQPGTVPFDAPPGTDPPGIARAWGAALVLIVIVMALNLIARIIGRIFAVKKG